MSFSKEEIQFLEEKGYVCIDEDNSPRAANKEISIDGEEYILTVWNTKGVYSLRMMHCTIGVKFNTCAIGYSYLSFEVFKKMTNSLERIFAALRELNLHCNQIDAKEDFDYEIRIETRIENTTFHFHLMIDEEKETKIISRSSVLDRFHFRVFTLDEFEDDVHGMKVNHKIVKSTD